MSHRRRHQWFRRVALGLAFAAAIMAGRVSVAAAEFVVIPDGSVYVAAGGWSGVVDAESGIPLSAGIPYGDDQTLSKGLVCRKEAVYRPDGDASAFKDVESWGQLSREELAFVNAVVGAAESLHDPLTAETEARSEANAPPDDDQLRLDHPREALAERLTAEAECDGEAHEQERGGSSEHLTPQHQGIDYPQ